MSMELLMQYVSYLLMAIGVLAFLTSIITQVIKEMPGLKNIQTNAVALVAKQDSTSFHHLSFRRKLHEHVWI